MPDISLCLNFLIFHTPLYANRTQAGVDIANRVVVNYSMNGESQTPIESSPLGNSIPGIGQGQNTLFKVDRKIDLLVTSNGDTNANLGDLQAELQFTLINEGNDSQEFLLVPDSTLTTDDFDTSNCTAKVTTVSGTPLPGVTLPTTGNIRLKADQQASISVTCDIPLLNAGQPILAGQTSLISLYAIAENNSDGSPTIQTVAPDTSMGIDTYYVDGAGTDDLTRDASHSSRARYIALDGTQPPPPSLTIDKSIISVTDPQGGNTAVTGSEIIYKIMITTSGIGTINNVVITDPAPSGMTYKPGTLSLNNTLLTDINDADSGTFDNSNNLATVNLGNITAGNQYAIQLTFIIN